MTPDQTFNPSPDLIPEILSRLGMPESSLTSLAADFNTTTEALSLWMSTPEIEARIATIAAASAHQLRFAAVSNLSSVLKSTLTLLNSYTAEERAEQASAPPVPPIEATSQSPVPPLLLFHERRRSSARRLAHLVLRLATFNPLIPPRANAPARIPSTPTPATTSQTPAPKNTASSEPPAPTNNESKGFVDLSRASGPANNSPAAPAEPATDSKSPSHRFSASPHAESQHAPGSPPATPDFLTLLEQLIEARTLAPTDEARDAAGSALLDLAEQFAQHVEQEAAIAGGPLIHPLASRFATALQDLFIDAVPAANSS